MVDMAFSFSAASLAASSCLQNLCDLLIIRGALKHRSFVAPRLLFWLGVGTQSVAGAALLADFYTAWMAGVLVVFILVAPIIFHNFWTMEGEARFLNRIIFICDYTCVLAALILIASSDQQAWSSLIRLI